jgi:hypothetical protein
MIEKRAVAAAFPEAVFVTFNGSEFRDLFPATMPIFYMYSLRRRLDHRHQPLGIAGLLALERPGVKRLYYQLRIEFPGRRGAFPGFFLSSRRMVRPSAGL